MSHEIAVSKMDTDASFHLTFTPLDSKGQPTSSTGGFAFTNSDNTVCSLSQEDSGHPTNILVTLAGKVGNSDITLKDNLATVVCHLTVGSGAETDATIVVSA